jgi:hypothetical protein
MRAVIGLSLIGWIQRGPGGPDWTHATAGSSGLELPIVHVSMPIDARHVRCTGPEPRFVSWFTDEPRHLKPKCYWPAAAGKCRPRSSARLVPVSVKCCAGMIPSTTLRTLIAASACGDSGRVQLLVRTSECQCIFGKPLRRRSQRRQIQQGDIGIQARGFGFAALQQANWPIPG